MKKINNSIYFGLASAALIFSIAGILIYASHKVAENQPEQYPSYNYQDYVDRSATFLYKSAAGGQLYEAEKGQCYGGAYAEYNQMASARAMVGGLTPNSKIQFRINSDSSEKVLLTLRICYYTEADADASALDLLSLSLNNESIPLDGIMITRCESDVTFKENRLVLIPLIKGENLLDITSLENSYTLDYLVLTPLAGRSDDEKTIGVGYRSFFAGDASQLYEAEESVFSGPIPIVSNAASGLFYLRNDTAGGSISFFIEADAARTAPLLIGINNYSQYSALNALYEITVNGKRIPIAATVKAPSEERGGAFDRVNIGDIPLLAGQNELVFNCIRGRSSLDYIVLNSDLGFSQSNDSQRLEAETFLASTGLSVRSSSLASGGKDLSGFALGERAWHHFASSQEKSVRLILSLSYTGSYPHLGDFLSLYLNNQKIDVGSVAAEKTSEFAYFEADCGLVSILEGDNVLEIRGLGNVFALDNVDFSSVVLASNFSTRSFEAENAITSGGSHIEFSKNASGGRDVGFNDTDTGISFTFYCEEAMKLRIGAWLSVYASSPQSASSSLLISLNDASVDLTGVSLLPTGGWWNFVENDLMSLDFKKGYNLLSFYPIKTLYNFDVLTLKRVLP